jgi:hypothetical protein
MASAERKPHASAISFWPMVELSIIWWAASVHELPCVHLCLAEAYSSEMPGGSRPAFDREVLTQVLYHPDLQFGQGLRGDRLV